jgi:predicted O-methyltransferase YrrM
MRSGVRRLSLAVAILFGGRRGYFIPYRGAGTAPRSIGYAAIAELFARQSPGFAGFIAGLEEFAENFTAIGQAPPPEPRWRQDWFPRLDAAAAYAIVRRRQPARIVEVGSGHSTRFMARAIRDGGLATRLTAIDPSPRAALAGLAVEWLAEAVPAIGLGPFESLRAGDVLFIDSSHVLMPGTDVDFLLNEVVPRLPVGALLHFHDIFLPDDYPAEWRWRGYSEQLGVATLLGGGHWRPIFSSHYASTRLADALSGSVADRLPMPAGAHESSLWLERIRE